MKHDSLNYLHEGFPFRVHQNFVYFQRRFEQKGEEKQGLRRWVLNARERNRREEILNQVAGYCNGYAISVMLDAARKQEIQTDLSRLASSRPSEIAIYRKRFETRSHSDFEKWIGYFF